MNPFKWLFRTQHSMGIEPYTVEQIAEMMKPDPNFKPDQDMVDFAQRMSKLLEVKDES